jgi:dolichol-phosphate mannosyltransferase
MKKKLSIIIPVFNNQGSLDLLLRKLKKILNKYSKIINFETIAVNDGSTDGSLSELKNIKKKFFKDLKIINHLRNYGSNLAMKTGFKNSTGDAHTVLTADLQEPPYIIEKFLKMWIKKNNFIIAERSSRDDPLISIFFSQVFYFFFRLIVNKNYPKNGFDIFLITKDITNLVIKSRDDVYVPIFLMELGYKYNSVKFNREKRFHGKSQWTFKKKILEAFQIFLTYKPTISRLVTSVGIVLFLIGTIYSAYLIYLAVFINYRASGFVTLFTYVTIFFGFIIILLGVLSEQVFKIMSAQKNFDTVIVKDKF